MGLGQATRLETGATAGEFYGDECWLQARRCGEVGERGGVVLVIMIQLAALQMESGGRGGGDFPRHTLDLAVEVAVGAGTRRCAESRERQQRCEPPPTANAGRAKRGEESERRRGHRRVGV